jgi:hypothetical protein
VRRVELSDVCYESSDYAVARPLGVELAKGVRGLLAWCFCPSCRQQMAGAGGDADGAQAALCELIDRGIASEVGGDDRIHTALETDTTLRAYAATLRQSERELVSAVASKLGEKLALAVNDSCELVPASCAEPPHLVARRRATTDRADSDIASRAVQSFGGERRVSVRFDAYPPYEQTATALVADVHAAAASGHPEIGFYADGLWPSGWLDGVRQAIRYARRES